MKWLVTGAGAGVGAVDVDEKVVMEEDVNCVANAIEHDDRSNSVHDNHCQLAGQV